MPKSNFIDGVTSITAAFLNLIFAHVHDGLDQDGSAPKVELENHTDLDFGAATVAGVSQAQGSAAVSLSATPTLNAFGFSGSITKTGTGAWQIDVTQAAPWVFTDTVSWAHVLATALQTPSGTNLASLVLNARSTHNVGTTVWSIIIETRDSSGVLTDPSNPMELNLVIFPRT